MVSLKDIALACNVSIATVSKALNDQHDVSVKTKETVRKKAREMGYFSNASHNAAAGDRLRNIGVLFAEEGRSSLTKEFFVNILDSFKRNIEVWDYDLTLINCSKSNQSYMTYAERAMSRGFDGVLIAGIDFKDPEVIELIDSNVPVVTINYLFNNRMAVISDNIKGMRDLVTYVYEMGHRKIAYIHGEETSVTQERASSFFASCEQLGIEVPDDYIKMAFYGDADGTYKRTMELLDLSDPPTCILYPDDLSCFGGINAIKERGLRIPEDLSVAGYDGSRIGKCIKPELTTICQDTEQIGKLAAESMIRIIEHPRSATVRPTVVEGELCKGGTVRKINTEGK